MKKTLLLIAACILCSTLLKAQSVAINTDGSTANASSILDIKSITKGLLIPRMTTAQRTAIVSPAKGLFVFDTDINTFWFHNGTVWTQLSAGSTGWNLSGNGGTNSSTNFIGTTDNTNLRFKINNSNAGYLASNGNIFWGLGSGNGNLSGYSNIAIGADALKLNTDRSNLVAIGDSALFNNGTNLGSPAYGIENTAIGSKALYANITGDANTAIGFRALFANTYGVWNTATGHKALVSNTEGNFNIANGKNALFNNTKGSDNIGIGVNALVNNTTAGRNTAIGTSSLYTQSFNNGGTSWESGNVAVGYNTLYSNQPTNNGNGIENTAVGAYALQGNTSGGQNTASGYGSLINNTIGDANTASGHYALHNNLSGLANNGFGTSALYNNTDGYYNNAFGAFALEANTVGHDNIAIGDGALENSIGGSYNIAIGSGSGTDPGSPNTINTISIGNNGVLNAANNQAFIGNASTAWIGGQVGWFHYSDARIKTNIKEEVKGLDFIMRLRPVTYNKNLQKMREITGNKETKDFPGKYDIEKIKFSGFLAQEVEKAANESGYDFDGVHKPQNEHDLYSLSYSEFVVPLVKAVQEQQAIIKTQQQQIDLLMKRIEVLEKK